MISRRVATPTVCSRGRRLVSNPSPSAHTQLCTVPKLFVPRFPHLPSGDSYSSHPSGLELRITMFVEGTPGQ